MAGPDWVTGLLEPGQNLQIWMKMDKKPIFCDSEAVQNFVQIRHWAEMSKETNPDEPFFGAMNFRLLNFCGVWILSNSIFSDISHLILDEHPCQMNACMPSLPWEKRTAFY